MHHIVYILYYIKTSGRHYLYMFCIANVDQLRAFYLFHEAKKAKVAVGFQVSVILMVW